ncbi:MAG: tetratricopeptide repeat protein, partial [bacterium]|nr:tetratricopeptide repeat protein [bacterium]
AMTGEINYRYPGSRPFTDNALDRRLFFGRDEEKRYLFHSILVERLFVLFAKSGMGKTSLLNAGLMDPLRRKRFVPLTIRFNDRESTPLETVYTGIREAVKQKKIDYEPGETDSLWQFFKTAAFWSPDDKPLTPVLILDQFEEFFTMHSQKNRETFITQLADLVQGRVPRSLRESFKSKDHFPYSAAAPKVKIIISMREDYLGNLEEMSEAIPGILKNRFRLLPLKREQAKDAITKPAGLTEDENVRARGFSYAAGTVDEMLDFLCARRERSKAGEVEPFQLQLLCRHVEQKVSGKGGGYKVTGRDLGGKAGMKRVLQGFYEDRVRALGSALQKRRVRKLCEKGLIDNKLRLSLEEGFIQRKYDVSREFLSRLVDHRLLRSEPRVGSVYYELSHDTLVQPILESRKERKGRGIRIWLPLLVVLLFLTGFVVSKQVSKFITIKNLYEDAGQDIQLGDYAKAIEKYRQVLEIDQKSRTPYLQIGELSERLKKYDDAVANYEAAIMRGIKIEHEIIFYRLGVIYARYKKDLDSAVEYFNNAVELNPDLAEPHIALGNIYRKQQKFDEAREHYREALMRDDQEVDAYKGLAILFIERREFENALSAYKDAVGADPDYAPIYRDIAGEMKKKGMKNELETLYMEAAGVEDRDAAYYEKLGYDFYYLRKYD